MGILQVVTQYIQGDITQVLRGYGLQKRLGLHFILSSFDKFMQGLPVATSIHSLELLPDEGSYVLPTDGVFVRHAAVVFCALAVGDVGIFGVFTWWGDE